MGIASPNSVAFRLGALAGLLGCGIEPGIVDPADDDSPLDTVVTVRSERSTLESLFDTVSFSATAVTSGGDTVAMTGLDASGAPFTWASENTAVAGGAPDSRRFTALGEGEATISASLGSASGSGQLTVSVDERWQLIAMGAFETVVGLMRGILPDPSGDVAMIMGMGTDPGPLMLPDESITSIKSTRPAMVFVEHPLEGRLLSERTTALAVSWAAACALLDTTEVYCWPDLIGPELFVHGSSCPRAARYLDPSCVALVGDGFVKITAGAQHFCGLTEQGEAKCWGFARSGALGDGGEFSTGYVPVTVAGGPVYTDISAGFLGTCALRQDGRVLCWGPNNVGQLGTGSVFRASGLPLLVAGPVTFTHVAKGWSSPCALNDTGEAYCWGAATYGTLGVAFSTLEALQLCEFDEPCSPTPLKVATDERFVSLAVGAGHSCGLNADGAAFCWGSHGRGQLGAGDVSGSPDCQLDAEFGFWWCATPVPVAGGLRFDTLVAGYSATCGLTADGAAYCWGDWLGRNEPISTTPVRLDNVGVFPTY